MKISVVIPVYNAEKYIQRCILSIQNQTYPDWELILVDDGSKDNSLKICQKNAAVDERIKVIHQSNKGPGEARNAGIVATTGDFIVFVDADDYIDKDYFQMLSKKVDGNDVVFIDVQQRKSDGSPGKNEFMSVYKGASMDDMVRSCMTGYFPWGGVRKVASARLIKENNIKYSQARIGEEAVFTFRVLSAAKTFTFIDEKPVYFYELHEDSQSNIPLDDPWGDTYRQMKECLIQEGKYEEYASTLNALNVMATIISVNSITRKRSIKDSIKLSRERIKECVHSLDDAFPIDIKHLPLKAKVWIPCVKMKWAVPIVLASKCRGIFIRK